VPGAPPHPSYSGGDAIVLTDSCLGAADHTAPEWLGFLGDDVVATIDMGAPAEIRSVGVNFLQSSRWGIVLPREVEVAVSDDGHQFRTLKTLKPKAATDHSEPQTTLLTAADLEARARYVRVRAVNLERLPKRIKKEPTRAWLFVDKIIVK
jgi:hexosaminidase